MQCFRKINHNWELFFYSSEDRSLLTRPHEQQAAEGEEEGHEGITPAKHLLHNVMHAHR